MKNDDVALRVAQHLGRFGDFREQVKDRHPVRPGHAEARDVCLNAVRRVAIEMGLSQAVRRRDDESDACSLLCHFVPRPWAAGEYSSALQERDRSMIAHETP